MKRLTLFLISTMMICGTFTTSCTTEDDYFTEDAAEAKLQDLKTRILQIAAEYGFNDYQVDEDLLRGNLNITDEEIEAEMKMFALLPGTYILESDGNGKYTIKGKMKKRLTRSSDDFLWPEYENGSFDGHDSEDENFSIDGSFDYGYGQSGNDYFDAEFNVSCWETDENGNGHWGASGTGNIIDRNDFSAHGDMDNAGLGGIYVIEVKTNKTYRYFEITVEGTHGDAHASMSVRELSYSDSRVANWRRSHGR